MTTTSGQNTRSKSEAEKIVVGLFGSSTVSLRDDQYNQLCSLFTTYSDCYCDKCYRTGTSVALLGRQGTNGLEIVTSTCPCAQLQRSTQSTREQMRESLIPERYLSAAIGDWNNPGNDDAQSAYNDKSYQIVLAYAKKIKEMKEKGYGLFICGPNGVGKTYLACAIAANCIRSGFNLVYYTMPKIVQTVVGGWYEKDLQMMISTIEQADFLVIDDLDKAYVTKTKLEIAVLDNLFRERLQNNRPMLVTSNKTLEQIKESHGNSVFSMFSEHCAPCVFVGSDYRKGMADGMVQDILA